MLDFYYKDLGEHNEILLVILSGDLDTTQCDYLYGVIEKQISRGHKKVILDCDELGYVSSMGMAMMRRFLSNLIPQTFHIGVGGGPPVVFKQRFNPFIYKLTVSLRPWRVVPRGPVPKVEPLSLIPVVSVPDQTSSAPA